MWYFAYGSNMQSATLRGRRGIAYTRARAARGRGWRLVFDKPALLAVGHGFANIVPEDGAEVLGVLFEVSEDDLAHVEMTEGVLIGNYAAVEVEACPLDEPTITLTARSLSSDRRDPAMRPSLRYMEIVVEGALEHGLPDDHVAVLRAVEAIEESAEAAALRPMLDTVMKRR